MMFLSLFLATAVITNVADLASKCRENKTGERFDLIVTAVSCYSAICPSYTVRDNSGRTGLYRIADENESMPKPGNLLRVSGTIRDGGYPDGASTAFCEKIVKLAEGLPPRPDAVLTDAAPSPCHDHKLIVLNGTVQDVYRDDIDPIWYYIIVNCNGRLVYATVPSATDLTEQLKTLPDARVRLTGIYHSIPAGSRRLSGPHIALTSVADLDVIKASSSDPFDRPELNFSGLPSPDEISQLGRRRVRGHVLAVWHGNRILIRTDAGKLCGAALAEARTPTFGDRIDVVGFAETDLYRINLSRAIWRPADGPIRTLESAADTSIAAIFGNRPTVTHFDSTFHGKAIRLSGTVTASMSSVNADNVVHIETDGMDVPVNFGKLAVGRTLSVGCRVRISGTCILDTDNWQPHDAFPRIKGVILVPRVPSDLVVLSRPPWWTTGRLLAVIGALVVLLIGLYIWNRFLNRLVERRSRQLSRERSARDNADLKTEERMRLAVELHDTISQDFAGIALQIDSAQLAAESDPASVMPYLEATRLRMQHCRRNLRDCLWDLRSRAFEEDTLADAIRLTLAPHIVETRIDIDGSVKCHDLSDNTVHAVLCIVRELVVNAIRHGKAKTVRIGFVLTSQQLSLTVSDDGCGFDPNTRPGTSEGHFGLQGVIERVERLEGRLAIDSAPGKGTAISVENLKVDL